MSAPIQANAAVPEVPQAGAGVATPPPPPTQGAISPQYTPPPSNTPMMAEGGDTSAPAPRKNPLSGFFADINIIDVTISAFIVGAVIYSIQYHKFMMMMEKTGYADLSTRLNRVENDIASAKKKASEANASGGKGFIRRKRALVTL